MCSLAEGVEAMARRYRLYLVAAAGFVTVAVLALEKLDTRNIPSLNAISGAPEISQQFRLYSGELDPSTRAPITQMQTAVDILGPGGVPIFRYVTDKDRSTDDLQLKPDGMQIAKSQSYYPEDANQPGRHPHVVRFYAATSDTVVDEHVYRFNGKLAEQTKADENGGKHILAYGLDGQTVVKEVSISPRDYPWDDPVLQKEEHWREDARHTLSFRDCINPDKTRTLTDWDALGHTLKVMHEPEYGVAGTTAIAYFPGTDKIRLDAKADYYAMTARYLRIDGTLDHILKLSPSITEIQYFNPSGTKMTLAQTWWRKTEIVNGLPKFKYTINTISELNNQGEITRDIGYSDGKLEYIWLHNVELNGITYAEADYNYDPTAGFMASVNYWQTMGHQADSEETHTAAENIRPPVLPPRDLTMLINPDEDNLPIPPPQPGYPG
jgi:hypothetical protein